jgi:hypothetical protein
MDGRILLPRLLFSALAVTVVGGAAHAQVPAATTQPITAQNNGRGPTSPRPGSGAGPPPPYTPLRWNEDYSYLKDPAKRTDWLDPIKYIPIGDDPDTYLSLGGSARYRYEFFDNNNFGAGPQDDDGFHLTRFLAHADLHLGKNLRGFVQIKSAMEDGREGGPRPIDSDEFDLQQAFVDLKLPMPLGDEGATVTLRGGRQDLAYGAQRLVGPLDWANTRRTFEGGKATLAFSKKHSLDVFLVRPVVNENEEPNTGDGNTTFAGLYDTLSLPTWFGEKASTKLDLYGFALLVNRPGGRVVPPFGGPDEDRYTIGARLSSAPKPFDFDVEATYQFGKSGSGDIAAWSIASEVGYTLENAPLTPRMILGFDMASGDDDPADADNQTFNQLFPTAHPYLGYIDALGRQNIIDLHGGAELILLKEAKHARKVALRAEHHLFWRQSDADAIYNPFGFVTRADLGSDETYVGSETDLLLNWQIDRHWSAYAGYSHFFAGDFLQETGPSDDIDFFYAALQFTF